MAPPRGTKRKAEDKSKDPEADVEAQPGRVFHPRKGLAPRRNGSATLKDKREQAVTIKKPGRGAAAKVKRADAKEPEALIKKKKSTTEPEEKEKQAPPRPVKKARAKAPELNLTISRPDVPANVYVFGKGDMAELGLGPQANARVVKRPRINHFLLPEKVYVVQVACGGMHSLALTKDSKIYSWGVNDQGALGRNTTWEAPVKNADASDSEEEEVDINPKESIPGVVEGFPENIKIVQVAAGDSISVAVTDEGYVYAWGTFRVSVEPQDEKSVMMPICPLFTFPSWFPVPSSQFCPIVCQTLVAMVLQARKPVMSIQQVLLKPSYSTLILLYSVFRWYPGI